jgi:hypothetical protein
MDLCTEREIVKPCAFEMQKITRSGNKPCREVNSGKKFPERKLTKP